VNAVRLHNFNVLLMLAFVPILTPAQDTSSGATATPATTTTQAKTTPAPAPAEKEKKKPKKVWTNDELGSVEGDVSVVGEQDFSAEDRQSSNTYQANNRKNIRQQQIRNYRGQIQQLQGQIDAAEKRISQLKNFKGENTAPSGGINPTQGYNMVPLEDQVKQLEERKKQLQARIEDVENDARKNGIEPGELR
jgi:predicted  nucleic acid-binding Zn-ribbon protein